MDFRLLPDGGGGTTEAVDSDGCLLAFVYGLVADHVTAVEVLISAGDAARGLSHPPP